MTTIPKIDSESFQKPLPLETRIEKAQHPVLQKLFQIVERKKTNLIVAFDVTKKDELFELLKATGPYICMAKFHIDILEDFDQTVPQKLRQLADRYDFLLFEDRKFADIGSTVQKQFANGIYKIADWADIINAHVLPGEAIIDALKKAKKRDTGLLLLAQMSSAGNLLTPEYTQKTIAMAEKHSDFVIGFICQEKLSESPDLIHATPGVKLETKGDGLGQQYNTPAHVIGNKGSDFIIVGRGIIKAEDPAAAAQLYRDQAWQAYTKTNPC